MPDVCHRLPVVGVEPLLHLSKLEPTATPRSRRECADVAPCGPEPDERLVRHDQLCKFLYILSTRAVPRHFYMPPDPVPKSVRPRFDEIVELVEAVCRANLTDEYAAVTRALAAALARKRPSPLLRGQCRTWACGSTYTIGSVNFLFDPAQRPHVRGADLCALFGVSQSAGAAKSREIMRLFDIVPLDPRWTLPSRLADNPLVWMIPVNGVIVDMRMMPREIQEQAYALG